MTVTLNDLLDKYAEDREDIAARAKKMRQQTRGYQLKELRKSQSLSQAELAERIGVSQRQVSKIERGDLDNAKVTTLRKYVEALGLEFSVTAFLGGKEFPLA